MTVSKRVSSTNREKGKQPDHDHNHAHTHESKGDSCGHDHGIFHTHAHDHSEGAEQLMTALSAGKLDRGTKITLLGKCLG